MKNGFTMIELIFVIVLIGILAMVAVPKFTGLTANTKVTSELATISSLRAAIDSAHGEWSINEGDFTWGNNRTQDDLNDSTGYPKQLGSDCDNPFNYILKSSTDKWKCVDNNLSKFQGPASSPSSGVKNKGDNKPDSNDVWIYYESNGTIVLQKH